MSKLLLMSEISECFGEHLSDEQIDDLETLRKEVSRTLDNNIFRHFTDHGVFHSDRMIKLLKDILEENLSLKSDKKLCREELVTLILSIYLHDIGLEVPLAHGVDKPITQINQDDFDLIRKNHGKVSAEIILDIINTNHDKYGLSINITKPSINEYMPIVAEIVSSHQSKVKYEITEIEPFGMIKIRTGLLTALLRITDQLDCTGKRVNMVKILQYSIPRESIIHWIACHYIDGVFIEDGNIRLVGSYPSGSLSSTQIEVLNKNLIKKINFELELNQCLDYLWKNKIKLKFNSNINPMGKCAKEKIKSLPEKILETIQKQVEFKFPEYTKIEKDEETEINDWISYWEFIGNPFLDRPLSYGSEHLVETKTFKSILSELEKLIEINQGHIKLLIAERGFGKTTLFQVFRGKFGDNVSYIDAAEDVLNVNTPTELSNRLFSKTEDKLFGYDVNKADNKFDKIRFFDKLKKSKFRIICIDALDRLPPEKEDIFRDFLKQSQATLSDLRQNSIVILSCSDKWKYFLDSTELSYLKWKNQWVLDKFSTKEAKQMLEKRLISAGKSFNDVFENDVLVPLHTMSNANPRDILGNAEHACRIAFNKKIKKINSKFLQEEYKGVFESAYTILLDNESKRSPQFKDGLLSIYCFIVDIERRNLDIDSGCEMLSQLIIDEYMQQNTVDIRYYAPVKYIANITTKKIGEKSVHCYKINEDIKKFFNILNSKGYSPSDFLSFYSRSQYLPPKEVNDIKYKFKKYYISTEDGHYYEQGRLEYNDLTKNVSKPYMFIKKSWDVLENLIVAILIKIEELNPHEYDLKKQEIFYTDRYGIQRYKGGAGKILAEQSNELIKVFKDSIKKRHMWIDSLTGMQWIRLNRNNILKTPSHMYQRYDDKSLNICRGHIEQSFNELVQIYHNIQKN